MPEQQDQFQRDARVQTWLVTPELIAYIVEKIARGIARGRKPQTTAISTC